MICYRDRSYCGSDVEIHTCNSVLTEVEAEHAEQIGLPIAYMNYCDEEDGSDPLGHPKGFK